MRRMNIVVDEQKLEQARRATGERTYSATIDKALEEIVRVERLDRALDELYAAGAKGDLFEPDFLEEYRANSLFSPPKRKISASEKRLPRKRNRRGTR